MAVGMSPLLFMLFESMSVDGHFSLNAYAEVLQTDRQWTLMRNSLTLASAVALLTTLVGVPIGILFGKTDLPFRRFFTILFVTPLLVPPYISAVSWSNFFTHAGGFSFQFLFGLPGAILVLFTVFLPVPMLLTIFFLRSIDPSLEEAGRVFASWGKVMRGITIPLIFPAIALSFMLVFILSFGELSVANFLRYDVYAMESFTQFSAFYNFKAATAAALPLVVAALLFLWVEEVFLHKRRVGSHAHFGREVQLIPLGTFRVWLFLSVAILGFTIVLLPLITLLIQSAGLSHYIDAFDRAGDSMLRTLLFGVFAATLLTFFGFFTGYLIHKRTLKIWRLADAATIFLFALPGTVIGIGLISLWNTPWTNFIYAGPAIIIFGLLAKYTALTSKISAVQLSQISPSMEEAAQVSGAGWFRTVVFIVIPLAWRGLAVAWIIGYIFSLRDTAVTMLIYPAGQDTLPIRILTLMANGSPELIASLCVIMILITLLPAALFWLILKTIIKVSP